MVADTECNSKKKTCIELSPMESIQIRFTFFLTQPRPSLTALIYGHCKNVGQVPTWRTRLMVSNQEVALSDTRCRITQRLSVLITIISYKWQAEWHRCDFDSERHNSWTIHSRSCTFDGLTYAEWFRSIGASGALWNRNGRLR